MLILVGAAEQPLPVPPLRMLAENLTVAGIVNAARPHLEAALADLERIPREWLAALVERRGFARWPESFSGPVAPPKVLHRLD